MLLFQIIFIWRSVQAEIFTVPLEKANITNDVLTTQQPKRPIGLKGNIRINTPKFTQQYDYVDNWWLTMRGLKDTSYFYTRTTPNRFYPFFEQTFTPSTVSTTVIFDDYLDGADPADPERNSSYEVDYGGMRTHQNDIPVDSHANDNTNMKRQGLNPLLYDIANVKARHKQIHKMMVQNVFGFKTTEATIPTVVNDNLRGTSHKIEALRELNAKPKYVEDLKGTSHKVEANKEPNGKPNHVDDKVKRIDVFKTGHDHNVNVFYNKVVKSHQMNVSENDMPMLAAEEIEDIKRFYGLSDGDLVTDMIASATLPAINRQGIGAEVRLTTDEPGQYQYPDTSEPPLEPDFGSLPPQDATLAPWLPWMTHPSGDTTRFEVTRSTTTQTPSPMYDDSAWTLRPGDLLEPLRIEMGVFKMGFFSIFVSHGAFIISNKTDSEVRKLSLAVEPELEILKKFDLRSFGEPFLGAFESFAKQLGEWPVDDIKAHCRNLNYGIHVRRDHFTDDLNALIDYIDFLFREDEGINLFRSLEVLNNYPNGSEHSFDVIRNISVALFAPYRRLAGTNERKVLVDSINEYVGQFYVTIPARRVFMGNNSVLNKLLNFDTKFAEVSEDSKTKLGNKTANKSTGLPCTNRCDKHVKYRNVTKESMARKIRNSSYHREINKKATTVKRSQKTPKHLTTQMIRHRRIRLTEGPKIYKKYVLLKLHRKHKKKRKEKLREFKLKYFGKHKKYANLTGYKKYSKIKAEKLRDKLKLNITETDFDEEYASSSEYHTDFNIDDDTKSTNCKVNKAYQIENTNNFVGTTPKTKRVGDSWTLLNLTVPHVAPKLTHYDLSISGEDLFRHDQYEYRDMWWVTIRDFYRGIKSPKIYLEEHTTEAHTPDEHTTEEHTTGEHTTEAPSVIDTHTDETMVHNTTMDKAVRNKLNLIRNGLKGFDFKSIHKDDFKENIKNRLMDRKLAQIKARNKQIQRMLVEITKDKNTTETTKPYRVQDNLQIVDLNKDAFRRNHSVNLFYNKVVESLQMNVSGNEVGKLEIGHLGDLKRYYDLNHAIHQTPTANIWALTTENAIHRQGDPPGPPGPPDNYPDKPPPWLHPNYWGTTTTRATTTTTTTAVPPSVEEEPPSLLLPFQKAMDLYRMGYFSVFVSLGSHIVSEKSFNDVRLLSMSLEREFHRLHDDDKHILGFGEPFLGAFEHFVKQMGQLPADYIKSQAQILQHSIHFRREYFADQLNSLMDYIDSLYNEDEGVALVQSLDALNLFPKNTWNSYEILRNISDSLFAPYKRLAGTVKRELLVESLNDFLEKVGYTLLGEKNIFGVLNITDTRRKYSNKTRFAVVGRETSGKTRQTDTRLSNTPRSVTNIKRETYDAEKKLREINTKIKNAAVKIRKVTRKDPTAVTGSQPTYHTTQQKSRVRMGFKEKHPKIYDKYLQLKKKAHKKHRKKEKFREFKKRYFGNMFPKLHGYERYSKMKAEKLKNKLLLNLSDTDFDGEYLSDSESYDSDFSAIVYKMKQAKTKFKDFNKGRQSTLRVSASKLPSKKFNRTKKSSQFTQKSHTTAKTLKITKSTKVATKRIRSHIINQSHSTVENNAVAAKTNILKKLNEKLNKLTNKLGIDKSRLNKISLQPDKNADTQVNKTNKSSDSAATDFTKVKFKSVTAKNKIAQLSSYSDEEDVLKFKISDAMRHDKPFLIPQRRLNNFKQRFKKDIDVSYSSDEVVLKSKIYQSLGFQNFSKLNEVRRRANNDINEGKVKKIRFQKFKPVNEISSYSDEEDTLKEKLKL